MAGHKGQGANPPERRAGQGRRVDDGGTVTSREPGRTYRLEDELYFAAQDTARMRGETVSHVIRRALMNYVRRHAAEVRAYREER